MKIKTMLAALGLGLTLSTAGLFGAGAQILGGDIRIDGASHRGDVEILAGDLRVVGPIDGDIEAIGGDIEINADVTGSVEIAGGHVQIHGTIGGALEAVGGDVFITASGARSVEAAGGHVRFAGSTPGSVELSAGDLRFLEGAYAGDGGELRGGHIEFGGQIDGDVRIWGEEVEILPSAVISGQLIIRGPREPVIAEGAQIAGGVDYQFEAFDFEWGDLENLALQIENLERAAGFLHAGALMGSFLLGLLALLVSQRGIGRIAAGFRARPAASLVVGLILYGLSPVVIGMLFFIFLVTVIGIPVAIILLMLAVPFYLLITALGAIVLGDLVVNRSGGGAGLGARALSMFVILAFVAALGFAPLLGYLAGVALSCIGLGAWVFARDAADNGPAAPLAAASAGAAPAQG